MQHSSWKACDITNTGRPANERPWVVRARTWISLLVLLPFATGAALSVPIINEDSVAGFVLDAVGWMCFVAGASLRWWATLYLGGRKDRELVEDGPFSLCRNPLYLGIFLLTLSIAFFLHSLTFAVGLLVATPVYLCVTVPWEEERLREKFGECYDVYRSRVPKFIPTFSTFSSTSTVQVDVAALIRECRNMARWMWIPLLSEAVAHQRMSEWWPTLIYMP